MIGIELGIIALVLVRRGRFRWLSAGFWGWCAFALYFVLSPLAVVISKKLIDYQIRLDIGGGAGRGFWIIFVLFSGILVFFLAYLRTPYHIYTLGIDETKTPFILIALLWLLIFGGFGTFSLLASRSGLASWGAETVIQSGRFTGEVTGYQYTGYIFLIFPIIFLMAQRSRSMRVIGSLWMLAFIFFSLPHGWSRFVTISMLLASSMIFIIWVGRRWPPAWLVLSILAAVFLYQARGHESWDYAVMTEQVTESWNTVTDNAILSLAENDTQMLATFWLESYVFDYWKGYEYGLPFINYILSGWIPSRIFPQKYFIVDWLASQNKNTIPMEFDQLLYGAKSSLVGSFYRNGGLAAVLLEMALAGWLSRRLDGFLDKKTPTALRALGIVWLSVLWMVWGSSDFWGFSTLGVLAIPAFFYFMLLFLFPNGRRSGFQTRTRPQYNEL